MRSLFLALAIALVTSAIGVGATEVIPARANAYRHILTREARNTWGLDANVALFASQIQQESAWNPQAKSPVGAGGLGQFMPGTGQDMNRIYQNELGQLEMYSPLWSIRALVLYDYQLQHDLAPYGTSIAECDLWKFTFSAYNGGPGWVERDRRLAKANGKNPDVWDGNVADYSTRSKAAFKENRDYPQRIIYKNLPLYLRAGWKGTQPCE